MSDIKNENDDLKDFPNYNKSKFNQIFPEIKERDEKIRSLITTIESQKEEIEQRDAEYLALFKLNADVIKALKEANKNIESLKAITELAVKELKIQLDAAKVWGMDGTVKSISTTLSEIARLSHELDK